MDTQRVGGFDLDGPRLGPAAGGAARQLVVLLHGLGADGNDLIGLAPHLARVLPEAAFVSPHAPFPCDMAPFGRQWFSLQDRAPEALRAGVRAAAPILDGFLDDELARHGLGDGRLAIVGFSQGTMTGLHAGLRRAQPCARIVGFSGALVGPEDLEREIRSRPPVLLIHGEADEIVPFPALAAARAALEACRVPVEAHGRPGLGHGIDQQGLELAAAALAQSFAG
jgi:phospholipase/carboxylesterase